MNADLVLAYGLLSVVFIMIILSTLFAILYKKFAPLSEDNPTPVEYEWTGFIAPQEAIIERGYLEPTAPIAILSTVITESSTDHR